ncbi:hypothetical protein D3C71_1525150 [compost metagenome]
MRSGQKRDLKTVLVTGLLQQGLCLCRVIRPVIGQFLVVVRRDRRARNAGKRSAAAIKHGVDDFLAANAEGNGLAQLRVLEHARTVEAQIHERAGSHRIELEIGILLDRVHRAPRHVVDQVDIAGGECRNAQVLVRIRGDLNILERRQAFLEIMV